MEECGGARDGGGELAMSNTCLHSSPGARRGAKRHYGLPEVQRGAWMMDSAADAVESNGPQLSGGGQGSGWWVSNIKNDFQAAYLMWRGEKKLYVHYECQR